MPKNLLISNKVWAMKLFEVTVILASLLAVGEPHGYMIDPPQRSSMWRVDPKFPHNYNDMELYCGGRERLWNELGGECGTCGDPYDAPIRENEAGGIYATGTIGRKYTSGQIIKVKIVLTAFHLGHFQFKICPHNNPALPVSKDCLDQHILTLAGSDENTYTPDYSSDGEYEIDLQLPPDMVCSQCILQWTYTTGNSPGYLPEMFVNCADIAISADDNNIMEQTTFTSSTNDLTTTTKPTTTTQAGILPCSTGILMCEGQSPDDEHFCTEHCRKSTASCTPMRCKCQCLPVECKAIGPFEGQTAMDKSCQTTCTLTSDLCRTTNSEICFCSSTG